MRRRLVALVAALLAAIGGLAALTPAAAEGPGGTILARIIAAAGRGDARASAALDDLKSYASRNRIDLARISAEGVADSRRSARSTLSARGLAPFWIDVFQDVTFDQSYAIGDYVVERRADAASLSGGRRHAGLLSMSGFVPLDRLCELRAATNASIDDAVVDVWLGGSWCWRHDSMGTNLPKMAALIGDGVERLSTAGWRPTVSERIMPPTWRRRSGLGSRAARHVAVA
jgi:hypothetical protein